MAIQLPKFVYASVTDPSTGSLVEFGNTFTVLQPVAIPFTNTRAVITMPAGFKPLVSAYLWGAGGGGGGTDSPYSGGYGAGGSWVRHDFEVAEGDVIEVSVGGPGRTGAPGSGATGGNGGPSRLNISGYDSFSGAPGGRSGYAGWSGSGGGGGGATVLLLNNGIIACAGSGGGAGGGGHQGYGYNGENSPNSLSMTVYPAPLWGTYPAFLNNHGIWNQDQYSASFDQSFTVNFPATETYTFTGTCDNAFTFYVDGTAVMSGSSWPTVYSSTHTISAGTHSVRLVGTNWGGPASIGLTIDGSSSGRVFDSRNPPAQNGQYKNGSAGGDHPGDGGGGGGGGGGWIGAEGGSYASGDTGGVGGGSGTSLYNITMVSGSGRFVGASQVPFYQAPSGEGGTPGADGNPGYAVLIFRPEPNGWIKNNDGDWKRILVNYIKTDATTVSGVTKPAGWKQVRGTWVKQADGWKKLAESGDINVNTAGYATNYGTLGRATPWVYVAPPQEYYNVAYDSGGGDSGGSAGGCGDGGCGGGSGDGD